MLWLAGSPFEVHVRSALRPNCDASKLHISGPGIKHGLLSTFCSYFSIDTTDAGIGQLNVTVRGPKGILSIRIAHFLPPAVNPSCSAHATPKPLNWSSPNLAHMLRQWLPTSAQKFYYDPSKGFFVAHICVRLCRLGLFFITFMHILAIVHSQDPSTNLYDALEN